MCKYADRLLINSLCIVLNLFQLLQTFLNVPSNIEHQAKQNHFDADAPTN